MNSKEFGKGMRQEFCLSNDYTFVNHASLGAVPKCVVKEKLRILELSETCPDKYLRWGKDNSCEEVTKMVANFVKANRKNLAVVNNATTGITSVIRSLKLKPGDTILVNSLTYPVVKSLCQVECGKVEGAKLAILDIPFPIESEDSIVELFERHLQRHSGIKLVVIDHITSSTALVMPVKRVVDVCRSHGVMVMVDGAHAPGQIPVDIEDLQPDFYIGDLHKWCYVPRGLGFLWVSPRHQSWTTPLLVSHNHGQGVIREFLSQGTMDFGSYFSAKAALNFYEAIGGFERISQYTTELSAKAAAMLSRGWGTYQLPVPENMRAPNMKVVKLPSLGCRYEKNKTGCKAVMYELFRRYNVSMWVVLIEDEFYIRVSAQIYNTMADYHVVCEAVLDFVRNNRCQSSNKLALSPRRTKELAELSEHPITHAA